MFEKKANVISISKILLVAASICIYQAQTENKVGHDSKIESQGACENEYKKYFLNVGKCYYLVDEDIVGCNCTWLYGWKRCEKYMWSDYVRILDWIFFNENLTRRNFCFSKSVALYFFSIQNQTHCIFFKSKSNALCFLSIQNLTRTENFNTKSWFFKKARKMQSMSFLGLKWTKTWFFECEKFFKIWHVEKFLIQNLTCCIFSDQNLTRCKTFESKSDVLFHFMLKSNTF